MTGACDGGAPAGAAGGGVPGPADPLPPQGGISHAAFREAARMVFADLEKLMDGKRPERVVNGL